MRRHVGLGGVLLIAVTSIGRPLAAEAPSRLANGDELPPLEAPTLSGDNPTSLPRDVRGHATVLVMGFAKSAAKVTPAWLNSCRAALAAKPPGELYCYDVRMLEDVPRAFRGMMERGMKSGFPIEHQRHTLLVYTQNEAWRTRLGVADKKTAYLIGCDAKGIVRSLTSGQYSETEFKKILDAIEPISPH